MTVEQRKIVDIVSINKACTRVTLTVSDHLEWLPDNEHLLTLQEKLNDYMMFIESGEIYEQYPNAKGLEVAIDVVCMHGPKGDGVRFLELAKQKIEEAGVLFSHRVFKEQKTEQGGSPKPLPPSAPEAG